LPRSRHLSFIFFQTKAKLLHEIETYVNEKIIYAGEAIADIACKKIKNGDTLLIYAKCVFLQSLFRNFF